MKYEHDAGPQRKTENLYLLSTYFLPDTMEETFFFLCFLGPHLRHMEVPRLEV